MSGENFKPGDRVRLARVDHGPYGATIGATATVGPKGYFDGYGGRYLHIVWNRDDLSGNQMDGGYVDTDFDPAEPDPRDLAQKFRDQANAVESVAIAMRRLAFGIDNAVSAAEEVENLTANVEKNIAAMMEVFSVD